MKAAIAKKTESFTVTKAFASVFPKNIAKKVNLKTGSVFEISTKGYKIILTPAVDPRKAEIDAAIAVGLQAVEEGRVSPIFDSMKEAINWLSPKEK